MTDTKENPDRPDNLRKPDDDDVDHGARVRFDDRARDHSPQLWATTHRGELARAFVAIVLGVFAILEKRKSGTKGEEIP
ncbi:hypothetical protein [Halomarina litorea]|uniref:hypothetical protein n=1 Tax=Halomarina litorea TaxID=2961595 RepID=UPI0020C20FF3|nr:hypothetical protein [Halomarina sp. BCD28]